jgi:hypothetical protein
MIERYTIKVAPAVPHSGVLKKLDEMKEYDPEQMRKLQHLKVKAEVICEAGDLKRITDLLKELATG